MKKERIWWQLLLLKLLNIGKDRNLRIYETEYAFYFDHSDIPDISYDF